MEQGPSNDNLPEGWDLKDPDENGDVWFVDQGEDHRALINLGPFEAVAAKLAGYLEKQDYGER